MRNLQAPFLLLIFLLLLFSCKKELPAEISIYISNPELFGSDFDEENHVLDTAERIPISFSREFSNVGTKSFAISRIYPDGTVETIDHNNGDFEVLIVTPSNTPQAGFSITGEIISGNQSGKEIVRLEVTDEFDRFYSVEKEYNVVAGGPILEEVEDFALIHRKKELQPGGVTSNCRKAYRYSYEPKNKDGNQTKGEIINVDTEIDTFYGSWTSTKDDKFVLVSNIDLNVVNQGDVQEAFENGIKMDTVLRPKVGEFYATEIGNGFGYMLLQVIAIDQEFDICSPHPKDFKGNIDFKYFFNRKHEYL
jgi:hypothetical protein